MMDKKYEHVEFEVSIGNYGNKFESGYISATTESTHSAYDGNLVLLNLHFMKNIPK